MISLVHGLILLFAGYQTYLDLFNKRRLNNFVSWFCFYVGLALIVFYSISLGSFIVFLEWLSCLIVASVFFYFIFRLGGFGQGFGAGDLWFFIALQSMWVGTGLFVSSLAVYALSATFVFVFSLFKQGKVYPLMPFSLVSIVLVLFSLI